MLVLRVLSDSRFLQVTETDLYLLGAIEKLVYRIDLMDQRLRRAEDLVQHLIEGSNIKRQGTFYDNIKYKMHLEVN